MPYGWGAVFTNLTRAQIEKAIPEDARERILPDHLVLYKDDLVDNMDVKRLKEIEEELDSIK